MYKARTVLGYHIPLLRLPPPLNFNEQRFAHFKLSSDLCHQHVRSKQILKATMWVGVARGRIQGQTLKSLWKVTVIPFYPFPWNCRERLKIGKIYCIWRGNPANCWKFVLNWSFCTLLVAKIKVHPPPLGLPLFSNFYRLKPSRPVRN